MNQRGAPAMEEHMPHERRTVLLREERSATDDRFLRAYFNDEGALVIGGQDLGPATWLVSSDGEYEWATTFEPEAIPALLELIGAPPDADILDELALHWTGSKSYELEAKIRESSVPHDFWTFGG